MGKTKAAIVGIVLFLSGCISTQAPLKTVCEKEYIPVISVPAPPTLDRPLDVLNGITPAQLASNGELAKRYVAQVKTLEDYSIELENILADYQKKHDEAEVIRKQMEATGIKIPETLALPSTK